MNENFPKSAYEQRLLPRMHFFVYKITTFGMSYFHEFAKDSYVTWHSFISKFRLINRAVTTFLDSFRANDMKTASDI